MKRGKHSTRSVLGIQGFSRNGIQTDGHGEIVYFLVKPTNISVLSQASVSAKITHLMQLFSTQVDMEIICLDARENFDDNRLYLNSRLEDETNSIIRDLLERDKVFLEEIQVQMATAREFMFAVRMRNESDEQAFTILNKIEQSINEQGFECTRAKKTDVKRILARYFGINTDENQLDDHDGDTVMENWIMPTKSERKRLWQWNKKKILTKEAHGGANVKDFFDMISPTTMKFNADHFVCGDTYRSVWAIREYPPQTRDQAILCHLGDRENVTLHIYTRYVDSMEQKIIFQNAQRKNSMLSASEDLQEAVTAEGNLQDVLALLGEMRKNKEPLLHCAVFIEMSAPNLAKLEELKTEVNMELTRERITVDRLTLRQQEGFKASMPCGYNAFGSQFERVLPASAVANLYPFNYSGKTDPHGFYIGKDRYGTNILVDFDRRSDDKTNGNTLILGNSGQGKSYLLKLLLVSLRQAGKSIISLDAEQEYEELCNNLGGCYIDLTSGKYIINPLQPKRWSNESASTDEDDHETFRQSTMLSQHISYLKDFFRSYKDFTDAHIDALEILVTKLYSNFGIDDNTDFSKLKNEDYPIMENLYDLAEAEYMKYEYGSKSLFTEDLLREICLGIHSMCKGAESKFFNGHTNISDDKFICFGVKGLMESNEKLKDTMLFNILSYMNHNLLPYGNTVAAIDELYLFLTNKTAIEYIRNAMKRVRKKDSSIILASQNIEDFLISGIREYTKPLFSIPTHHFLFNPGNINPKEFMDVLQIEQAEFDLIKKSERGVCLNKCGNERYLLQVIATDYKARLFGNAGGR